MEKYQRSSEFLVKHPDCLERYHALEPASQDRVLAAFEQVIVMKEIADEVLRRLDEGED